MCNSRICGTTFGYFFSPLQMYSPPSPNARYRNMFMHDYSCFCFCTAKCTFSSCFMILFIIWRPLTKMLILWRLLGYKLRKTMDTLISRYQQNIAKAPTDPRVEFFHQGKCSLITSKFSLWMSTKLHHLNPASKSRRKFCLKSHQSFKIVTKIQL